MNLYCWRPGAGQNSNSRGEHPGRMRTLSTKTAKSFTPVNSTRQPSPFTDEQSVGLLCNLGKARRLCALERSASGESPWYRVKTSKPCVKNGQRTSSDAAARLCPAVTPDLRVEEPTPPTISGRTPREHMMVIECRASGVPQWKFPQRSLEKCLDASSQFVPLSL
jgi:hypothetical protein